MLLLLLSLTLLPLVLLPLVLLSHCVPAVLLFLTTCSVMQSSAMPVVLLLLLSLVLLPLVLLSRCVPAVLFFLTTRSVPQSSAMPVEHRSKFRFVDPYEQGDICAAGFVPFMETNGRTQLVLQVEVSSKGTLLAASGGKVGLRERELLLTHY